MDTDDRLEVPYEVSIEGETHPWGAPTITPADIRDLGGLPPDAKVVAVDLLTGEETVLPEDAVHEIPPLDPGKPLVKRMNFKAG
jgi:hypothetical protein